MTTRARWFVATCLLISSCLPEVFTLYLLPWTVCWSLFAALHWHGLHFVGLRVHCRAVSLRHVFSQHIT